MCRSEHAAVYAADGYARASGMPGYVYGQYGPGVANVVAGLADPFWASSPVISLTTSMRTSSLGRYEYQDLDQVPLHWPVTAWSKAAIRPDQAVPFLRTAIRTATSTPAKTVHLEIPSDILAAELPAPDVYAEPGFGRVPSLRSSPEPDAISAVVDALATADRPVLLAGTGVILSEAWDAVVDLAELIDIPVATSLGGKGSIDETHRLCVGLIGRYSRKVANDVVMEADLVLVVGSRLGGMTTDTWKVPSPSSRIVHIDADPTVLGTTYREELVAVGDAAWRSRRSLPAYVDARRRSPSGSGPMRCHVEWRSGRCGRILCRNARLRARFIPLR